MHAHGACRLTLGASTGCKSTCFLLREPFAAGFKERRLIQNSFIYFIMLCNFCIVVHFVLCVSQRFGLQFFLPPWLLTPWRAFRSHTWHRSSKPSRRTWQLSSVDGLAKWWFQSTALSGSLQGLICFCFLLGLFCFLSVVFQIDQLLDGSWVAFAANYGPLKSFFPVLIPFQVIINSRQNGITKQKF